MLYLLWALLNIGLFLFFLLICFKATRLLREKAGLFASVVFVFGLLSFVGNSNNDNDNKEPGSDQIKTWKFFSKDSLAKNSTSWIHIDLEKTLISTYNLGISYAKTNQLKNNIPVSANSWLTGFRSGTNWRPHYIMVNKTDDNNKFEYFLAGTVEWKLLGATIYSQSKIYKGIALVK